ncbi:MAG: hypothetical protein Q4G03_05825 [Planctomycetia bacterium]|nr:hypothetical protein [Planctomycetia bacterium]
MLLRLKKSRLGLNIITLSVALTLSACLMQDLRAQTPATQEAPKRLSRADSFVGVHFDFHAGPDDHNIGATTTEEMVQEIIDRIHPDFIQVDSKGHPGYASFITEFDNQADVTANSLKVWRDVTERNGVSLYTHYSGVYEFHAAKNHPDWALIHADGSPADDVISVFGDYKSKLLVPQMLELALKYKTDGMWLDGECWSVQLDYCDRARRGFCEKYSVSDVPTEPSQELWQQWQEYNREGFREYLRYYVTAVKAQAPNFQIASNWAFSDHMPEPVTAPVDFISGDFSPGNAVNAARYSTRLMSQQGIPWDLMAWSFCPQDGWKPKSGPQLSREAACVLAQGGAFQAYITQNRDGSVNLDKLANMQEAASFCRERQTLCQGSTTVPEIALFVPTQTYYNRIAQENGSLYPMITWQRPILQRLLEMNYSVDLLLDHNMSEKIFQYKMAVFFKADAWSSELRESVRKYIHQGGKVLLIGNETFEEVQYLLSDAPDVLPTDADNLKAWQIDNGRLVAILSSDDGVEALAEASGEEFIAKLNSAIKLSAFEPMVSFSEPEPLDVSLRRDKLNELTVCLVNVSGPHEQAVRIESIEPVTDVKVALRLDDKPKSLKLQPSNLTLDFQWRDSTAFFTIPSIPIFEIVVVEE